MTHGWAGRILRIDLTKEKIIEKSTMEYAKQFLGARGINVKIIFDEVRPAIEPFTPENLLIIGVGPLVGTGAPASARTEITTKSPQTVPLGLLAESSFGGYWGAELKFAGYDNLVIKGKSEKPTYR